MPTRPANRGWFWAAVVLTAVKVWLTDGQTIFAIGPAIHDDRLFVELAARLLNGEWLGPYNQFTLAKGPLFPLFIAGVFWLGLPLLLAQQLLYAAACASVTRAVAPWLRTGAAQFSLYAALLWNPMSYDAGNLSRLMRQNLYTPLALFVIAGLVHLYRRRRETWSRQLWPALLGGLAFGGFWLTREESVWLLPAVGLLWFGLAASLRRELPGRARALATGLTVFTLAALGPSLVVSTLNLRHYGWFGTVEFRAPEFNAAYGALTRPLAGPELAQVPVTRQMREQAYELSPEFRRLRPYLEGFVSDNWSDKVQFPASERQMRGGWFVWALRDAVAAAGLAPDAGAAMRYYQRVADELNAACDAGRVPARPPRRGFLPPFSSSLVRPLLSGATDYSGYFLFFEGFTAYSPDSIGDYAELKPFRNLVGTRLSLAPRSPEPLEKEQAVRNAWKLATLERLGQVLGRIFAWLGPILLLVGLVRGLESLADRRVSFPLGLAAALLAACAAYLAINILVHVTSFYNMSPAALASAYPLYLLALGAIATDAVAAWRQPSPSPVESPCRPGPPRWSWLLPAGTALFVLAARLGEIHTFASDVPSNDQWVIEADQIIAPWLNGTLGPGNFFIPHFEHLPVWTRLLAWLQVVITGRWDPLVQMTVNATLHAGFVWLVARWAVQCLRPVAAVLLALLLILGGSLPHAWENITWGFQSQFPLALIFLYLHVWGTCTHAPGSRGWWLAQAAALAGLFTLASMWLAPFAVVVSWLWTGPRRWRDQRVPLIISALGAGLLVVIHSRVAAGGSFAQIVQSPLSFLNSCLHLLGWPGIWPGSLAIIQLPWVIHALRLRGQAATPAVDRLILVLGLWNALQALALAFARSGDANDFVSRYGDLLFVGVLAGALALVRLAPPAGRTRSLFYATALLWGGLVVAGLVRNSTEGHAHYFHLYAAQNGAIRRTAVQAYLASGNRDLLDKAETRGILYQDPGLVTRLLDQPKFIALLPSSVRAATPVDPAGTLVRGMQAGWPWLLAGGAGLCLLGGILLSRQGAAALPRMKIPADPWRWRFAAVVGVAALGLLLAWSDPLGFNRERRWQRLLGGERAVTGLTFSLVGPSPYGPERLQGAAPILPEVLRNQFYGTAPDGPGFTCTALSSPFVLTTPWVIVPYAGYPVGNGNGLRLRLVDGPEAGKEIGYEGPNQEGIAYWVVDVRAHVGRQVRLVLYDGRTDTEAWVAAAPPILTDNPGLASTLAQGLKNETHASSHAALGVVALVAFLCALLGWLGHRAASGQPRSD